MSTLIGKNQALNLRRFGHLSPLICSSEAAAKAGKKRPRVAVCGERAGRLWAEGKTNEVIQLERFCDTLAETYEVDILCVYPLPRDQEEHPMFKDICAEHSTV